MSGDPTFSGRFDRRSRPDVAGTNNKLRKCFGGTLMVMKRPPVYFLTALAASTPFRSGTEDPRCESVQCVVEQSMKVPDQPHTHEEPPTAPETEIVYMAMTSPATTLSPGEVFDWVKDNGPDSVYAYRADTCERIPLSSPKSAI